MKKILRLTMTQALSHAMIAQRTEIDSQVEPFFRGRSLAAAM